MLDWESYRRPDGTINLLEAWASINQDWNGAEAAFLDALEAAQPIRSRQLAALALMQCRIQRGDFGKFQTYERTPNVDLD